MNHMTYKYQVLYSTCSIEVTKHIPVAIVVHALHSIWEYKQEV